MQTYNNTKDIMTHLYKDNYKDTDIQQQRYDNTKIHHIIDTIISTIQRTIIRTKIQHINGRTNIQ